MKKALIITTVGGFVPRFEMDNVKLLQELGYQVHYASNFKNRVYEFTESAMEDAGIILHQIDIDKNPYHLKKLQESCRKVIKLAREETIDLVHCHTPVGAVIGRIVGKKLHCKVIYTAHGFHFYQGAPIRNWLLYYPIEKMLSKYTDCLITINDEDYKRSQKFSARECVLIPGTGLDLKKYHPKQNYKNSKKFKVVSIGELNRNKNHQTIIQAIGILNDDDIEYCIYGKGDEKENLEKIIHDAGLEKQVFLCGFTDNVPEVLREADCFAFPSIREGLGMAGLEAMACGVPLVAADNRGSREYINHGENGFTCRAEDPEAFAYYIKKIKDNPGMAECMSRRGVETVQWFSKEHTRQIMQRVYRQISL